MRSVHSCDTVYECLLLQAAQAGAVLRALHRAAFCAEGQAALLEQLQSTLSRAARSLQTHHSQQALLVLVSALLGASPGLHSHTPRQAGHPLRAVLQELLLPALERAASSFSSAGRRLTDEAGAHDRAALSPVLLLLAQLMGLSREGTPVSAPGEGDQPIEGMGLLLLELPADRLLCPLAVVAGARRHTSGAAHQQAGHHRQLAPQSCREHLPSPEEQSLADRILQAAAEAVAAATTPAGSHSSTDRQHAQCKAALAALPARCQQLPWATALPLLPLLVCAVADAGSQRPGDRPQRSEGSDGALLSDSQPQGVARGRRLPTVGSSEVGNVLMPPSLSRLALEHRQVLDHELEAAQTHGYPAVAGRIMTMRDFKAGKLQLCVRGSGQRLLQVHIDTPVSRSCWRVVSCWSPACCRAPQTLAAMQLSPASCSRTPGLLRFCWQPQLACGGMQQRVHTAAAAEAICCCCCCCLTQCRGTDPA